MKRFTEEVGYAPSPFVLGDRVRYSNHGLEIVGESFRGLRGTVISIKAGMVEVKVDGFDNAKFWHPDFWRKI